MDRSAGRRGSRSGASPRNLLPASLRWPVVALPAACLAVAVSAAMVAISAHYFTDVVAGAAVGTGLVLAGALILDLVTSRVRQVRARPPVADGQPWQPTRAPNRLPGFRR